MAKQPQQKPTTIAITNFSGRLTRMVNGELNSGFAKFSSSWGYDPFSKPLNLTWLYQPTDVKGTVITDAVLDGIIVSPLANEQYVYGIGSSSKLYKIDPTNSSTTNTPLFDSPSVIAAIGSVSGTFTYGGTIGYYNNKLHITSDSTVTTTTLTGANIASVTGSSSIATGIFHPQVQFLGSLYIGNGNNLLEINSTGTVVNGAKLSPALPSGMYISDLDVTPDGSYMVITASNLYPNMISPSASNSRGQQYAVDSYKFLWNGTDAGITAFQAMPSFPASSLNTFLNRQFTFVQDAFGMGIYEGDGKLLTLPNNIVPMNAASSPNGTFLTWATSEGTGAVNSASGSYPNTYTSLYYYGQLDAENPAGLWRLLRQAPSASNQTFAVPLNMMVNNFYNSQQFVIGWGKHYISVWEYNSDAGTSTYHFYRFVLPPAANTNPVLGVYETQTQLFSKRIGLSQIRVYTEPTAANNGFQLDVIGADGNVVTNGTYTYTYGDITDPQSGSASVERINFNTNPRTQYALGIRITNTGTSNMTIKKVEIDYTEEGK